MPCRARRLARSCGFLVSENNIVSEIGFTDNGGGAGGTMVGQFVPSASTGCGGGLSASAKAAIKGGSGGGYQARTESRELTLQSARRRISQVASRLSAPSNLVEAASRVFNLALQHNFLQGRKTENVVAACLYIVCRRQPTAHMLLDFSEALRINVFTLGHTFKRLSTLLNFQMPLVDPALFIQRFAACLEFGERTHDVSMTALKLVAHMKRDWMATGRRPAGICGACLVIAARMHGFKRPLSEVARVVHVGEQTLRRRLSEFSATPTALLTTDEFHAESVDTVDTCHGAQVVVSLSSAPAAPSSLSSPCSPRRYRDAHCGV